MIRFAVTTNDELYVWGYNGHGMIEPGDANVWQPIKYLPNVLIK